MDIIRSFVESNDVDMVCNTLSQEEIESIVSFLPIKIGEKVSEFMNAYSYLAYGEVEFFGINASLKEKSQMVVRTCVLNNTYSETKGFLLIEDKGDGQLILVDGRDEVYLYLVGDSIAPEPMGINFCEYVVKRFKEAEF